MAATEENPYADAYDDIEVYREHVGGQFEYEEVIAVVLSLFDDDPVALEDLWNALESVPLSRFDLTDDREWTYMRDNVEFLAAIGFANHDWYGKEAQLTEKGKAMVFETKRAMTDAQLEAVTGADITEVPA